MTVIYGSADGLVPLGAPDVPGAQVFTQDSPNIPNSAEPFDRFGTAVAAGDFDGDGFSDLAIGVPGEDLGTLAENRNIGGVLVIRGSRAGLVADPAIPARFLLINGEVSGAVNNNAGAGFGSVLAAIDLNGDGASDLVAGAPSFVFRVFEDFPNVGAIWLLFGSQLAGGLTREASFVNYPWDHDIRLLPRVFSPAVPYRYGAAFAVGDFNDDGFEDLAIGAPETLVDTRVAIADPFFGIPVGPGVDRVAAGAVFLFFGSVLETPSDNILTQVALRPEGPERGDRFGAALAAGDFDGDGHDDLAVGVPGEDFPGCGRPTIADSGLVEVFRGGGRDFAVELSQRITQETLFACSADPFGGSRPETGDGFGAALAAGDFNGDGRADLAVGVPNEDVLTNRGDFFEHVADAGEVDVVFGSPEGLSPSATRRPQAWHQDVINVDEAVEASDRFGRTLAAADFGNGPQTDLAIGVPSESVTFAPRPGESRTVAGAGAVNVLFGRSGGLSAQNDQLVSKATAGVPGAATQGGLFGIAIE